MPTDTPDQQITMPIGPDAADNPVAFVNMVADVEQRLVRAYASEADRTARMLTIAENSISTLAAEDRVEIYNGANQISLYRRSLYAFLYKTASQNLTPSSTALQNVTELSVAMPAAGTFSFRGIIYYDSNTTADIRFAFSTPAAVTLRWNGLGVITTGSGTGDATFTTVVGSDTVLTYGGGGAGVVLSCQIEGEYVAGGTAGTLQFRAAQGTSDPGTSIIIARSRLEVWRHL